MAIPDFGISREVTYFTPYHHPALSQGRQSHAYNFLLDGRIKTEIWDL